MQKLPSYHAQSRNQTESHQGNLSEAKVFSNVSEASAQNWTAHTFSEYPDAGS